MRGVRRNASPQQRLTEIGDAEKEKAKEQERKTEGELCRSFQSCALRPLWAVRIQMSWLLL